MEKKKEGKKRNVGFVATRLVGTDGVSMETQKWADIFEKEYYLDIRLL